MATFVCTACGNLHGAPVSNCGICGSPAVTLKAEGYDGPPAVRERPTLDAEGRAEETAERRKLLDAEERRQDARHRAHEERADRLVSAGVKLCDALIKLVDRTPLLPGSLPKA